MTFFHITEKQPPKDEPFLALTVRGFEMMDWKESLIGSENPGWYGFYCPCSCCRGHCSGEFELWIPLPEKPNKANIMPQMAIMKDQKKWRKDE